MDAAAASPIEPADPVPSAPALRPDPGAGLGPAVAGGPERGQRLEPRHPLVQPLELGPAGRAGFQMLAGRGVARLGARLAQAQQGLHGQVRHASTSSPSQRRSR